jgi:hypothetical protein
MAVEGTTGWASLENAVLLGGSKGSALMNCSMPREPPLPLPWPLVPPLRLVSTPCAPCPAPATDASPPAGALPDVWPEISSARQICVNTCSNGGFHRKQNTGSSFVLVKFSTTFRTAYKWSFISLNFQSCLSGSGLRYSL